MLVRIKHKVSPVAMSEQRHDGKVVLWVIRGDEDYGVGRATVGMAAALTKSDCRVVFATVEYGTLSGQLSALGYRVITLDDTGSSPPKDPKSFWGNVARHISHQLGLRRAIQRCADDCQCDWVHVRHNDLLPLAAMAGLARKVPIAWHIPNTINAKLPFGLQAILLQILCKLIGVFPLANSQHTADSLGSKLVGVEILRVGVDSSLYAPDAVAEPPQFSVPATVDGPPIFGILAEPFGLSIVEAMLMQKPVLAYNLGGPSETVVDGQTGWHIDNPSVEACEAGLVRALRDRAVWHEMGQLGRARALREYTTEVVAGEYLRIVDAKRRSLLQQLS